LVAVKVILSIHYVFKKFRVFLFLIAVSEIIKCDLLYIYAA